MPFFLSFPGDSQIHNIAVAVLRVDDETASTDEVQHFMSNTITCNLKSLKTNEIFADKRRNQSTILINTS